MHASKRIRIEDETRAPFRKALKAPYFPKAMQEPPALDHGAVTGAPVPRFALLINPFYAKDPYSSFGKHVLTPTLALTSIAGSTPSGWKVEYWDENLLQGPPPTDRIPEVVGITTHLTFAQRTYELARWYRERGAKVILGGLHVMSCPHEVEPHADAMVFGEGVQVWPTILRDIESEQLEKRYEGSFSNDYGEEPPPDRSVLPSHDFLTTASLIGTRGCHNRCRFCYLSTADLRIPYRVRPAQQIADEFAATGEPFAVFIDNNLGSRPEYLRELCHALAPLDRIWSAAVTIDVTNDPSLVRDMALSGCTGVFIGFESLSNANIRDAKKKTVLTEDYAQRVALLHDYGIAVNGSFVLGFDCDGPDVFETTTQWVEENHLECATFHILTPYPGTPLFDQMEREGRILHRNWNQYDTAHVVFQPKRMSPEELLRGYAWCYDRLFTPASIWKRRPPSTAQFLPYFLGIYLYKHANRIWPFLIRHRLAHRAWAPLVEIARRRHVHWKKTIQSSPTAPVGLAQGANATP